MHNAVEKRIWSSYAIEYGASDQTKHEINTYVYNVTFMCTRVLQPLKRVFLRIYVVRHSQKIKRPKKTVKLYYSFKINGVRPPREVYVSVCVRTGIMRYFVQCKCVAATSKEHRKRAIAERRPRRPNA